MKNTPKPQSGDIIGTWAFVVGFIVAIITGFAELLPTSILSNILPLFLIVLGIIVGFLNIKDHEAQQFLIAGVSLVLVSWLGSQTLAQIPLYQSILQALLTLFVPATLIVALRTLFIISHK